MAIVHTLRDTHHSQTVANNLMEILLPIILLIITIWLVSQSRGVKYAQYQRSSSTTTIDLRRNPNSIFYDGIDLNKSSETYKFEETKIYRDEKKMEKPWVYFDTKNDLLILFSHSLASWSNRTGNKFKPEPYKNIIPFKKVKSIKKDKHTDFRQNCYDIELDENFGKLRIEFPNKEYSIGKKIIDELNKKTVGNNV